MTKVYGSWVERFSYNQRIFLRYLLNRKKYDRSDSSSFDYQSNGIQFSSLLEGKINLVLENDTQQHTLTKVGEFFHCPKRCAIFWKVYKNNFWLKVCVGVGPSSYNDESRRNSKTIINLLIDVWYIWLVMLYINWLNSYSQKIYKVYTFVEWYFSHHSQHT